MGIIIDIVLVIIVILSAFLGYKKGLVKLATKLFAGIIAIVVTIILYRPIAGLIINNTSIDEKIENVVMENMTSFINESSQVPEVITNQVKDEILPEEASNIAKSVIYAVTAIVLFVVVKVALSIVIALMDSVASLPILKQFNEVGGIIYGVLRGVVVICICVLLIGVFVKINPQSSLNENIQNSLLTKTVYRGIVKF